MNKSDNNFLKICYLDCLYSFLFSSITSTTVGFSFSCHINCSKIHTNLSIFINNIRAI